MNKHILYLVATMVFLTGCGDGSELNATSTQENNSGAISDFAIYLPGGGGLDFGKSPRADIIAEDSVSKLRVITYEFHEGFEAVDSAISGILLGDGYLRTELPPGTDKKSVHYQAKGGKPIIFRYREEVKEGFHKRTLVLISWRL